MVEKYRDQLLDHEYDGIREFDNPCPAWWHAIFLGSVVFSLAYYVFFHMGTQGWTLAEAHDEAQADNMRLRFAEIGELKADEATLLKYMNEPSWLAVGTTVYKTHCKSCHGEDGIGAVGPNMTDDYYKNVKTLVDVAHVVENGAANGSMPAWRNRLHPNEIVLASAYVASLRGKNLPGPRGNEGEIIAPWPTAPSAAAAAPAGSPATSADPAAAQQPAPPPAVETSP